MKLSTVSPSMLTFSHGSLPWKSCRVAVARRRGVERPGRGGPAASRQPPGPGRRSGRPAAGRRRTGARARPTARPGRCRTSSATCPAPASAESLSVSASRVGEHRAGVADRRLVGVRQAVLVGVGEVRPAAGHHLERVGQPIAVGVDVAAGLHPEVDRVVRHRQSPCPCPGPTVAAAPAAASRSPRHRAGRRCSRSPRRRRRGRCGSPPRSRRSRRASWSTAACRARGWRCRTPRGR